MASSQYLTEANPVENDLRNFLANKNPNNLESSNQIGISVKKLNSKELRALESQLAQVENFKQKQATISSQSHKDLPSPQANSTAPLDDDISSLVGPTDYMKAELQQIKDKFKTHLEKHAKRHQEITKIFQQYNDNPLPITSKNDIQKISEIFNAREGSMTGNQ